ncbi:hypothetical protein P7C70_g3289, partial [Phenoliferia sp. Uapishka_3]
MSSPGGGLPFHPPSMFSINSGKFQSKSSTGPSTSLSWTTYSPIKTSVDCNALLSSSRLPLAIELTVNNVKQPASVLFTSPFVEHMNQWLVKVTEDDLTAFTDAESPPTPDVNPPTPTPTPEAEEFDELMGSDEEALAPSQENTQLEGSIDEDEDLWFEESDA